MLAVHVTLSLRYLRQRWVRAALIVVSIAAGVSLLVATVSLNQTMARAATASANPMAGTADLLVTNGEFPVDRALAKEIAVIPGVQSARPRIFERVKLPEAGNRAVLLIGLDFLAEFKDNPQHGASPFKVEFSDRIADKYILASFLQQTPVVLGKSMEKLVVGQKSLKVQSPGQGQVSTLTPIGTVHASGAAAVLGGHLLLLDLKDAGRVAGFKPGKVSRIDIALKPGANLDEVQNAIAEIARGKAEVRTPEQQGQAIQNVMASMQVMLLLCGIAALVVGLFLVYNALSVSVAERRHEIGILLSLGATRNQIWRLFAGEAALLGLIGSLLGIPLGLGLALVGLEPMQGILREIFGNMDARSVDVSPLMVASALAAGILTAVVAAIIPAVQASRENPADAVRRMPTHPTITYRLVQIGASGSFFLLGLACILLRNALPVRFGMYGGLGLVVVAALLATPFLTAFLARLIQPIVRQFFGIEARLAADNIVRSPGRTGLVIAALAAGVALVMQTSGMIGSNRQTLREWVKDSVGCDLIVTSGGAVNAGGQTEPMKEALGDEIRKIPNVEAVLPVKISKQPYRDTQICMLGMEAAWYYKLDSVRLPEYHDLSHFKALSECQDGAIISENFSILHGVHKGDTITLGSPPVKLKVVGIMVDYSWNHGTVIINRAFYAERWDDHRVDVFDVYVKQGTDSRKVQETLLEQFGAEHSLFALTQVELQTHIDSMIERLYGIAYGQQLVVMLVAALGVVTALLISVLQRRRELGLLRAIGATRNQIVKSVLAEALLMGIIGTVIGLAVAVPLQWYSLEIVFKEETGFRFPVHVPWLAALFISVVALVVTMIAGIGPALHAVRLRIPEAIALE